MRPISAGFLGLATPASVSTRTLTRTAMAERKDDRLWGGRFESAPDAHFDAFQRSFSFDRRLLPYEIAVDRAWAGALGRAGVLTEAEVRQTLAALAKIADHAEGEPAWVDQFGAAAERSEERRVGK